MLYRNTAMGMSLGPFVTGCIFFSFWNPSLAFEWRVYTNWKAITHFFLEWKSSITNYPVSWPGAKQNSDLKKKRRAPVSLSGFVTASRAPPFHGNHLPPPAGLIRRTACQQATSLMRVRFTKLQSDTLTTRALVQSRFCCKHREPGRRCDFLLFFCFFDALAVDQRLWYVLAPSGANVFPLCILIRVAAQDGGPSQLRERVECTVTWRNSLKSLWVTAQNE